MSGRSVSLQAFAKVNLHLAVLSRRPDGYHELETLFERVDLADRIHVEQTRGRGIDFHCDSPEVPRDGTNLAVRAAELFLRESGWSRGVRIVLEKTIPAGGGLGGGSSDAAATLLALQELSGGALQEAQLLACAAQLGSDVAFFATQQAFAVGRGRGEKIEPVQVNATLWHLLVTPDFSIPTRAVYEAFRASAPSASFPWRAAGTLTATRPDVTLLLRALEQRRVSDARGLLFNALEPTVEALYPAIRSVKAAVEEAGLVRPCVSGSGSTVFALCESREEAEVAAGRLRRERPQWRVAVVHTM